MREMRAGDEERERSAPVGSSGLFSAASFLALCAELDEAPRARGDKARAVRAECAARERTRIVRRGCEGGRGGYKGVTGGVKERLVGAQVR